MRGRQREQLVAMHASYECTNLRAEVGPRHHTRLVLDEVSFAIARCEFVSIMGRSGVGKTTLLRILAGLHEPTPDSVMYFGGQPVVGPPEGVSLVFQDYTSSLLPWRTVAKNVQLPLEGQVPKEERASRVAEALKLVGLDDRADARPFELSGGMQQRVQLARALASRPTTLLMRRCT